MKLSRDEETFLRRWMYDEVHYLEGAGAAKRLQVQHGVPPAELALLVAAAFPDPDEQEAAALGPSHTVPLAWPWDELSFPERLREARSFLTQRLSSLSGNVAPS